MRDDQVHKTSAITGIAGAVILFIGTLLHPLQADPNDPQAAFIEYASHDSWVAVHLIQLFGIALIIFSLVLLSKIIASGKTETWAQLGTVGATASLAIAIALQAVDGVALKVMVDHWAIAQSTDKEILFYAAFGVRQIEVGLASMLSLILGITAGIYGIAQNSHRDFPAWLGWLAILGGLSTTVAGIVMAETGFSNTAMLINMPANFLLLIWITLTGIWVWKMTPMSN
jgi:hypothetical protein